MLPLSVSRFPVGAPSVCVLPKGAWHGHRAFQKGRMDMELTKITHLKEWIWDFRSSKSTRSSDFLQQKTPKEF